MNNTRNYIKNNWNKCIRVENNTKTSIKLPFPYTTPCAKGLFDDFYYWDTYFLNKGLLLDGFTEQAKNNILDICYLISKFGFMPNANREDMLNRSQPPLFVSMIMDYYEKTNDEEFLKQVYESMKSEIEWWIANRSCNYKNKTILFFYSSHATDEFYKNFYNEFASRVLSIDSDKSNNEISIAKNALGECESGWDFSPRFKQKILDYFPIDLNSIMYFNIISFIDISNKLNIEIDNKFKDIVNNLKEFININFKDKSGIYNDYNHKNNKISEIVSVASIYPYTFGLSNNIESFKRVYALLNKEYGIATTEKPTIALYQWAYPNIWPPLVFFTLKAAIKLNLIDIAEEIANKYISMVDNVFNKTGALWEKYDCLTGDKSSRNEYTETEMMGWTAGTYIYCDEFLKGTQIV